MTKLFPAPARAATFPAMFLAFGWGNAALAQQGPRFQPPPLPAPAAFKTPAGTGVPSRTGGTVGRPDWWTLFGDPALNDLEARAARSNQNVLQAVARIEEERLRARASGADFLPRLESNLT